MDLPFSKNIDLLKAPLTLAGHTIPNRLVIQPMEGCDGTPAGGPDELTKRRYERFARSGAGLIWFEAVAVVNEGRANPRQLYLNPENAGAFKHLADDIRETARKTTGTVPLLIMQLTHSGRYSKPYGPARDPAAVHNNPHFEGDSPLTSQHILTDERLRELEEIFPKAARMAAGAGFDGVDIKSCHGYLLNELLAAHTRTGDYGGSYENRTRFIKNVFQNTRSLLPPDKIVTSRISIHDGYPYPYGWGVSAGGGVEPELTEPIRLLRELNPEIINITMGNPYQNPQMNRPLCAESMLRMARCTKQIQDALPDTAVVASGISFAKERMGELAAGLIESGAAKLAGYGRMAFAYPDIAADILNGTPDRKKVCTACSKCTGLMRAGAVTGCVIRDPFYTKLYQEICRT